MGVRELNFFFCSASFVWCSMLPFAGWCAMMMLLLLLLLLLVRCVVNEGIVLLRHQLSV